MTGYPRSTSLLLALFLFLGPTSVASRGEDEPAFESLFNGTDLSGWRFTFREEGVDPSKTFLVRDGMVVCTGRPVGYMSTEASYERFTLSFDFRYARPEGLASDADFGGNSGYLLFVQEDAVWPRCIEVQGMNRDVAGIIPIKSKAEFETDADARERARKPVGEWNHVDIVVRDGKITASLNGTLVSTVTSYEPTRGRIGFQSEGAEIHWKDIRIRRDDG